MHFNLNARITVNGTEGDPVHFALVHPAKRGPASLAEAQAPTGRKFIPREILHPANPQKRAGRDLRVSRTGTTERFSAS